MVKKVLVSVFVLMALSACAHKAGKGHDCACGKETTSKCEGGHCAAGHAAGEKADAKGGCADCKGH